MSELRSVDDAEVTALVRGLVGFLREQIRAARKQVADPIDDRRAWWPTPAGGDTAGLPAWTSAAHVRSAEVVLCEVAEPVSPRFPAVPQPLGEWLDTTDTTDPATVEPRLKRPVPPGTGADAGVPARVIALYDQWIERWQRWAAEERAGAEARTVYERLEWLEREAEQRSDTHELVVGVGLLCRGGADLPRLRRHLLIWEAVVERDPASHVLQVRLASNLRARIEDRDLAALEAGRYRPRRRAAASTDDDHLPAIHPLSTAASRWLEDWADRHWTGSLDRRLDQWGPGDGERTDATHLRLAPALFLRERDRSALEAFYATIDERLARSDTAVPLGLAQLVVPITTEQRLARLHADGISTSLGENPLFPRPTNREQRRVLADLDADTAVVVQGPPGTGKTHTIANLVCALLAAGQRVLVTSEKDQALRVLREKLPESVKQMCVLMNGFRRGREELDRSITALSDLSAGTDQERLREEITALCLPRRAPTGPPVRTAGPAGDPGTGVHHPPACR